MSVITDVLIVTIHGDDEAIACVNRWLEENDSRKQQLNRLDAEAAGAGGWKVSTVVLYGAAFNHLDINGLEDAIRRAPWQLPECTVAYFDPEGQTFVISPARPDGWPTVAEQDQALIS